MKPFMIRRVSKLFKSASLIDLFIFVRFLSIFAFKPPSVKYFFVVPCALDNSLFDGKLAILINVQRGNDDFIVTKLAKWVKLKVGPFFG